MPERDEERLELEWGRQFKKDAKRLKKQGKNLQKLWRIVELLQKRERLPERCRDHALKGKLKGWRDCHIQPDWVLIYRIVEEEGVLRLYRTGSHSELSIE